MTLETMKGCGAGQRQLLLVLAARPFIEAHADVVSRVVLSTHTTGAKRIGHVYRKTHLRYFAYRALIAAAPKVHRGCVA